MTDLAKLEALIQDRKSKQPKGRASAPYPIVLDADIAVDLSRAQQQLINAGAAVDKWVAEKAQTPRQGGKPKPPADLTDAVTKAQELVDEIKAAADEVTVMLIFVALPADEHDELELKHPPRPDDEKDAEHGFNIDTFPVARMHACAARVETLDEEPTNFDPLDLIKGMSTGERDLAAQVVSNLTNQLASVPFYAASSQSRQRSGARSRRH